MSSTLQTKLKLGILGVLIPGLAITFGVVAFANLIVIPVQVINSSQKINNCYLINQGRIHFYSTVGGLPSLKRLAADPGSFKVIDQKKCFGLDNQHVYYYSKILDGADPNTFELLVDNYVRDNKRVFYLGELVWGADAQTFQILGDGPYWIDAKSVFISSSKVEGLSPKSAVMYYDNQGKRLEAYLIDYDNYHVYYNGRRLPEVDLSTFEVFDASLELTKDVNKVYWGSLVLEGFNPSSLVRIPGTRFVKNQSQVVFLGSEGLNKAVIPLESINANEFRQYSEFEYELKDGLRMDVCGDMKSHFSCNTGKKLKTNQIKLK